MKTFVLNLLILVLLTSCNFDRAKGTIKNPDYHSLDEIIKACEGHAVVVIKGVNNANFEAYKYLLIIKDTKTNKTYEYFGGKYEVNVGGTLK